MKRIRLFFTVFLISIGLLIALAYIFKVDYLLKAIRTTYFRGHTTAFLEDYEAFDNRVIQKSARPQPWAVHSGYNTVPLTGSLQKLHEQTGTVAFLIIKNDSIWHESYYDGFSSGSMSNSFSMAKSVVSAAMGRAISEGKIRNLDQKVTDFLPWLQGPYASQVTVGDLSSMASGLEWDERYYSPFSVTTRAYFDSDLESLMQQLPIVEEPGIKYKYLSGSTQLLALTIEKATGQSLTDYVSSQLWQPMGAENDALWQVDRPEGVEKAYCCIASNARDFARFGKLYKQCGNWEGEQILDTTFVQKSVQPRFEASPEYGYGWWLNTYQGKDLYYMRGHLGQYVIVIPQDDLIIVRLGHKAGNKIPDDPHSEDFYTYLDETYIMLSAP